MSVLNVVCVKAKPAYSYEWVNRLERMVGENVTVAHRFTCVTDDTAGLRCRTKMLPKGIKGWWAKLFIHRRDLFAPPVLYLDLDVLILGNLDFVKSYDGRFAILRDFYRPEGMGSGVMLWNEPQPHIWENWLESGCPDHILGDQGWMEQQVPFAQRLQDVFPEKFVSYKVHCEDDTPPQNAAVLSFHGHPKNTNFPPNHWVQRIWRGEAVAA